MKIKVIGTGAAGNKSAINAITRGVISENDVLLLNSTLRDIPEEYRNKGVQFASAFSGCGKERAQGKKIALSSIKDGTLDILDELIQEDDELVIIVSSTEGGTGCGSAPILAKYIRQTLNIPVMLFAFTGFEEDGRGLKNTMEYFQDIDQELIVQVISNKKFMTDGVNKPNAEKRANDEFAARLAVLLGLGVVDSEQNIDETDMFKAVTTSGYMTVGRTSIEKVKNVEQFNRAVTSMVDNDKALDVPEKGVQRLAIFVNAKPEVMDVIDYTFEAFKNKLGSPFELFTHLQHNSDDSQYVSFIASGMKMPLDEVKAVYDNYVKESEKVNKNKDTFFGFASELKTQEEEDMFDVKRTGRRSKVSKDAFLESFNFEPKQEENKKEIAIDMEPTQEEISKEEFIKSNF